MTIRWNIKGGSTCVTVSAILLIKFIIIDRVAHLDDKGILLATEQADISVGMGSLVSPTFRIFFTRTSILPCFERDTLRVTVVNWSGFNHRKLSRESDYLPSVHWRGKGAARRRHNVEEGGILNISYQSYMRNSIGKKILAEQLEPLFYGEGYTDLIKWLRPKHWLNEQEWRANQSRSPLCY